MFKGFGVSPDNAIAFAALAGILITIVSNGYLGVLISSMLIVAQHLHTRLR